MYCFRLAHPVHRKTPLTVDVGKRFVDTRDYIIINR